MILSGFRAAQPALEKELNPFFQNYIANVSSDGMAISSELASFCLFSARALKPAKIADLGSGFSSFVFRYYAQNCGHPCEVYSVDDNGEWLAKTKKYLESEKLSSNNLFLWSDFRQNKEIFDLILHDLGNRFIRGDSLAEVLKKANPGSLVILDDFHKHDYAEVAQKQLASVNKRAYSAYNITLDKFGRYSALVFG